MPCLEAHHSVGAGLCSAPTKSRKTVKFIKISAAPSIDGNRSTATSCKFATTSQSASLTAPLGGEPFCGGMELRGILRRLRRLRADWIFFLILRKAQNCGVDTPRNPVGRTHGVLAPLSAAMQKRHPKWDGVFAWWSRKSACRTLRPGPLQAVPLRSAREFSHLD